MVLKPGRGFPCMLFTIVRYFEDIKGQVGYKLDEYRLFNL